MTLFSTWVDSPPHEVLVPSWWAAYRALGFGAAAVMVESHDEGLDLRWSDDQLAHAGVLARAADVELALTYWPEPSRTWLATWERHAPAVAAMCGATAIDADAEGNWSPARLEGFDDLGEAAVELNGIFRGWARKLDVRLDFTTFPFHAENGPRARLAPLADRIYGQAYAVRNRKDGTGQPFLVDWDDKLGPHLMPHTTLERSLLVPGVGTPAGPLLCCGLAAYDQAGWPGHTAAEAMKAALDSALTFHPFEIRWWSSKHILGPRANAYTAPFFRSLLRP